MKTCSKCGVVKSSEGFSKNKYSKDGLHSVCKSCRSEVKKLWHKKTRDQRSEYNKKYHIENRQDRATKGKKRRSENKEKYAAISKRWQSNNPDKVRELSARYRAKKLQATPEWLTQEHLDQIKDIYAHARDCEVVTGDQYHVDHIVPLQGKDICGLHVPWNLQVLPAEVNQSKSNKTCHLSTV